MGATHNFIIKLIFRSVANEPHQISVEFSYACIQYTIESLSFYFYDMAIVLTFNGRDLPKLAFICLCFHKWRFRWQLHYRFNGDCIRNCHWMDSIFIFGSIPSKTFFLTFTLFYNALHSYLTKMRQQPNGMRFYSVYCIIIVKMNKKNTFGLLDRKQEQKPI